MRNKITSLFIFAFAVMLAITVPAFAQGVNQGSIEGIVVDATGAVVPQVALTATNQATSTAFQATTSAEGLFSFPVLPVGTYDLKIEKTGFAMQSRKNVPVTVGGKLNLPVTMTVNAQSETVDVTGETPVVETTRTQVSNTVGELAIRELPVNGRNFIDFALLTPGVTRDVRTGDLSFAGQRGTLNSMTVDGADNNNTFFGQTTGRTGSGRAPYQFSQDAVQEFQVNSSGYSAELGRAGGAVINVITKSGGNNFHGTGFWYFRDRGLASNDPINLQNARINGKPEPRKPGFHFNQFGGNIGGPIKKDKLFFFFDYDGQRNTQLITTLVTLPALAAPTAFQTAAINYINARSASYSKGLNQDTYLGKVDWNVSRRNQASFRYNRQNFNGTNFENGGNTQASEHTGNSLVKSDTLSANLTSTINEHLINVGRFQYQIDSEPGKANSNNPEASILDGGKFVFTVGRNSFSPRETTIHRQQYADTLTYVRGAHTLKGGVDIMHDDILNFFPGNFSGVYTFTSLQSFGCSLQGVTPGTTPDCPVVPSNQLIEAFAGTGTTGPTTHPNILQSGWFLQDDYRVRKNLTLNFGIRYDLQNSAQPKVQNPVALAAGIRTDRLHTDTKNIAPRFGFAYTPTANGKLVIRGGYGMFYGVTPSIMVGTAHSNNGINVQTLKFTGSAIPNYPNNACGSPTLNPNCAAPVGGTASKPSIYVFQNDYQQPAVQQSNLGVEYEVAKDVAVSIGYLWAKGDHLQRTRDINLGNTTPTPFTIAGSGQTVLVNKYGARPITTFNQVFEFESNASSNYNGMTLQLNKRFSHGFQTNAAYTWSHAIDNAPDATAVVPGVDDSKLLYDPKNPDGDRSSGVNDQRHRFVLSSVWQLPFGSGMQGFQRAMFAGWEVSGILTAQSGQPYSGLINSDLNNDGNRSTERLPNVGRNTYRLPIFVSVDPRFQKTTKVGEHVDFKLFVEAFNLFNRFNPTSVNTTQYAATGSTLTPITAGTNAFGLPRSNFATQLNGARIFQLGAKISF